MIRKKKQTKHTHIFRFMKESYYAYDCIEFLICKLFIYKKKEQF